MRFILERTVDPAVEVFSVQEMKRALRAYEDQNDEDTDIANLIKGAREWVEHDTGRALISQTWRLTITDGVGALYDAVQKPPPTGYYTGQTGPRVGEILLMRSPVQSITSFKTVDAAGDETTVDPATYELREADSKWPRLVGLDGTTWGTGTFRIVFTAGYATAKVPNRLRQAMKLWVEAMYDRDEKMMGRLLDTAEALISPERCHFGLG
jgi:hypothetical protein